MLLDSGEGSGDQGAELWWGGGKRKEYNLGVGSCLRKEGKD